MLHEFKRSWCCILFNSEQVLFEAMYKHYIYTLAIEQFCEVNLDSFAEIVHGCLTHDFVHSLEYHTFNDNLSMHSCL